MEDSLLTPVVQACIVLDVNGTPLFVKYYNSSIAPKAQDKLVLLRTLFKKSSRSTSTEVMMIQDSLVVYSSIQDLFFYLIGPAFENEILLAEVLSTITKSVILLLNNKVNRKELSEHLGLMAVAIDEILDNGLIVETDPVAVVYRLRLQSGEQEGASGKQTQVTTAPRQNESVGSIIQRKLLENFR